MIATEQKILARCGELTNMYRKRNSKMKDWYNILRLEDKMEEEYQESFVSNSPRTFYNLSKHLLTPNVVPHKFDFDRIPAKDRGEILQFQADINDKVWPSIEKRYKKAGRQGFLNNVVANILAYGWYGLQVHIDQHRFNADVWHPHDVYPDFSLDTEVGLVDVLHKYSADARQLERKAYLRGWNLGILHPKNNTIYDYWFYHNGAPAHTVLVNGKFAVEPYVDNNFRDIPTIAGPIGGLPDYGVLDDDWVEHWGEALVAVNESIYINSDRVSSYLQQAVKDAVEPKWIELSSGTSILTPERMKKSGSVFRGAPGDSVYPLQYPAIPIELQQRLFDYEQRKQEGSFSPLMFGSIQFQVAAYTLSQMAQAAQQVLRPYHEGTMGILESIDNQWIQQMRITGYSPMGIKIPRSLSEDLEMEVDFPVSIPGDLINRITVAKMMNPDLRFGGRTVIELLFPEIENSDEEIANSRYDMAMNSDVGIAVLNYRAYRRAAEEARSAGDDEGAELYEKAAEYVSKTFEVPEQQPQQQPNIPVAQQNVVPGGF